MSLSGWYLNSDRLKKPSFSEPDVSIFGTSAVAPLSRISFIGNNGNVFLFQCCLSLCCQCIELTSVRRVHYLMRNNQVMFGINNTLYVVADHSSHALCF